MKKQRAINFIVAVTLIANTYSIYNLNRRVDATQYAVVQIIEVLNAIVSSLQSGE